MKKETILFDWIFTIKIHSIQKKFPDDHTFVKELKKEYGKMRKEMKTEFAELNTKG